MRTIGRELKGIAFSKENIPSSRKQKMAPKQVNLCREEEKQEAWGRFSVLRQLLSLPSIFLTQKGTTNLANCFLSPSIFAQIVTTRLTSDLCPLSPCIPYVCREFGPWQQISNLMSQGSGQGRKGGESHSPLHCHALNGLNLPT